MKSMWIFTTNRLLAIIVAMGMIGCPVSNVMAAQAVDNSSTSPYLDIQPGQGGAFPASQVGLPKTSTQTTLIRTDSFDHYVPGLRTTGGLTLNPFIAIPYVHVPYLRRGTPPVERADFMIPDLLYVDFSLSSWLTFTDNVHQDDNNKKSDVLGQLSLGIDTILQLSENFQLQVAGNLAYYHSLTESGISGFGFRDSFYFDDTFRVDDGVGINGNVLFMTQVDWNRQWGNWDVLVNDRFYVTDRVMEDPFVNGQFARARETANEAGASAARTIIQDTRGGLSLMHGNYWYDNDFRNYDRAENKATLWMSVERQSMRFQPFADYTLRRIDYSENSDRSGNINEFRLGLRGPVTEQMNAEASGGYSQSEQEDSASGAIGKFWIDHLMNSRMRHVLLLERASSASASTLQAMRTHFQYKIGFTLGRPTVLWLGWDKMISRTEADDNRETQNWTGLASLSYELIRDVTSSVEYQYVNWDSNQGDSNYAENRVTLKFTWDI